MSLKVFRNILIWSNLLLSSQGRVQEMDTAIIHYLIKLYIS